MLRNYLKVLSLFFAIIVFTGCSNKEINCTIKGTVSGRDSDTIMLLKATDDPRFCDVLIPIKDSTFEYKLVIPVTEAYSLIFMDESGEGSWRPVYFFPENGVTNFRLFSDYEKNQISGGNLNKQYGDYIKSFDEKFKPLYQPLNDSLDLLWKEGEYYSSEMNALLNKMRTTEGDKERQLIYKQMAELRSNGRDMSLKGKQLNIKLDSVFARMIKWRYKYISNNPSIVSYYFLMQDISGIKQNKIDVNDIKANYDILSRKYPDHPYSMLIYEMLESNKNITIGGRFIDFSAPDLNGNDYKLSELIKGKVGLIDLWASWCGSCISASRTMIPVYEDFKDKGFTVIGVARERGNTDNMKTRIETEKYPWINLVELDDKGHIWNKYGIPNAGGGTFLVGKDGKILAINPTADEVRTILTEKLN